MTTPIVSRAELLRPWADAPCLGGVSPTGQPVSLDVLVLHRPNCDGGCHGTGLDKRFDALRGEHYFEGGSEEGRCFNCFQQFWVEDSPYPRCLRTDLGALVRVAAACGNEVLDAVYAAITDDCIGIHKWRTSPEDAAAAALVAALPERAA